MRKIGLVFFSLSCCLSVTVLAKPLYGIVTAMPSEEKHIVSVMKSRTTSVIDRIAYTSGNIDGKDLVTVVLGIGKINAATVTTRLISDFHPQMILLLGIAGGINNDLNIGDVVIGENIYNI